MDIRIQCLCVDAAEPKKIASFWEAALGWRRTFDEDGQVCIEPPKGSPEDGVAPDILFLKFGMHGRQRPLAYPARRVGRGDLRD